MEITQWASEQWQQETLLYYYHYLLADPQKHWAEVISFCITAIRYHSDLALDLMELLNEDDVRDELSEEQSRVIRVLAQQLSSLKEGELQNGFIMFETLCGIPDLSREARGYALAYRGECHRLEGRLEKALLNFDEALHHLPEDPWIIVSRGMTYFLLKRYEQALNDFEHALGLDEKRTWSTIDRERTRQLVKQTHGLQAQEQTGKSVTLSSSLGVAVDHMARKYTPTPISIFISYARQDQVLLNELKTHLLPLQRQGLIEAWYDRNISAGTEWEQEISMRLNAAQIILLLVSPDFMASDYCYSIEMKRALERHERGEARVIPVILRPTYWHGNPLGELQSLPTDGKPITSFSWQNRDVAFYNVAQGISKVVEQSIAYRASSQLIIAEATPLQEAYAPITQPSVQQENRTLVGDTHSIYSIAISPDGQTLVSGSDDHTIRVWDPSTGKLMHTLSGHKDSIYSIAISPDGQTLVSGSADHTITVWDLSTSRPMRTLTGHTGPILSVAMSGDGQTLVSGSDDHTIRVWDLSTGRPMRTLTGHTGPILSVAMSGDGQTLVSGSADHTIRVWRAR